jgi:hypothetical protein
VSVPAGVSSEKKRPSSWTYPRRRRTKSPSADFHENPSLPAVNWDAVFFRSSAAISLWRWRMRIFWSRSSSRSSTVAGWSGGGVGSGGGVS